MDNNRSPQIFFEAIAGPILYDNNCPYKQMERVINTLVSYHFENVKTLGKKLDGSLSIEMKKHILKEFSSYGASLMLQADKWEAQIKRNVDICFFSYPNRIEALYDLEVALEDLHRFARKTLNNIPSGYKYNISDLKRMRSEAEKVTLYEFITGSNDEDIISYYHALLDHTSLACHQLVRREASKFIKHMLDVVSRDYDLNSPWATIYNDEISYPFAPDLPRYLHPLVEKMAENVHNRWMASRKEQGWTYGPERNDELKTNPCMVAYSDLPEDEKKIDRDTCVETLRFILHSGFRIVEL